MCVLGCVLGVGGTYILLRYAREVGGILGLCVCVGGGG